MLKRIFSPALFIVQLFLFSVPVSAQPTWTLDPFGKEKKPEQFENRKLGSEKTADKKFTVPRNFFQNTITHYNYYFNANNKVNLVLDRAKYSQKDDYTELISFYPYSLDNTASQKIELDSVILTSTAGILLHDLRNDWIDNMYMLIGKAYLLRKDFDSALMTFQFINYNLFPRNRKNDDDDRIIGTSSSANGYTVSIANKEKRNILQKLTAEPPSRNDALIWMSRTLIEQDEFAESGGLINTLQNDPNLPKRLRNDLEEVNAYWFYKQGGYDSTAAHLVKALSNADTKQDLSRWEFLLGQLYEMSGDYKKASDFYGNASKHTIDPLLDIYARLNDAKMMKGTGNIKDLDRSINNLLRMGRKDKFENYRDIVYFSAGQLALQRPDTNAAISHFLKSIKYNSANINYKNKSYFKLADIAYNRKQYLLASAYYDSLQTGSDSLFDLKIAAIQPRKAALTKIVDAINNINREDSLQRITLMTANEREDYVKKLVRKLRKEKGLKDDRGSGGEIIPFGDNSKPPADLFADNNSKGEWYFYNQSLKSRGFSEFKSKWGNRANVDNWRTKSSSEIANTNKPGDSNQTPDKGNTGDNKKTGNSTEQNTEITYDALMGNLPLTEEKMIESNTIWADNLLILAQVYQNELEEYGLAAEAYEAYLKKFPNLTREGEVYLGLYFCYTKLGDNAKAQYYKDLLNNNFAGSKSAKILNNPGALNPTAKNPEITKLYEDIYALFIEGNFEKAMQEKKKADSLFGQNYWSPQLLYIEALNYIKNRDDSAAIRTLESLINTYKTNPLADKAVTMIDVLRRRSEIEAYLKQLEVTRVADDKPVQVGDQPPVAKKTENPVVVNNNIPAAPVKDSIVSVKVVEQPKPFASGPFVLNPSVPHSVLMVLEKVDPVYVTEARNAFLRYNRENYYGQPIEINKDALDADHGLLIITSFADADAALKYFDKIKRDAAAEISWLPTNKYSFLIVNDDNLQLLKGGKSIIEYKNLLNTKYSNRF